HAYLGGIFRRLGSPALTIGGTADHVHALCNLSRTAAVADLLRDLKRDSSIWIKERNSAMSDFHWQDAYGAFSVGRERLDVVRRYIDTQDEHHKQSSFQDEYRRILGEYGLEIDERYVWD